MDKLKIVLSTTNYSMIKNRRKGIYFKRTLYIILYIVKCERSVRMKKVLLEYNVFFNLT